MRTDLDTLLTALYVWIDDYLSPRRRAGRPPKLTDAELLTLAVAQALLEVRSDARWLRLIPHRLPGAFPYLPGQFGYNKRLRGAIPLLKRVIRDRAADCDLSTDPVWLVDSTPVECARSRPAAQRSALAGVAGYGYCASHSRYFWGLRLHLVCTPAGLPITWALAHPKLDERQVLLCVLDADAALVTERPGLLLIADKGYTSAELDDYLHARGADLLRPTCRNRAPRPGQACWRRFASSSSRFTTPSKASSTSSCTAGAPSPASPRESPSACSPSPPPSGTTAIPASRSQDH